MDSTPMPASLRTVLIAVAAVLALVGGIGLASGAADDGGDNVTTANGKTTTTLETTESTLGAGGDTSTTAVSGPATTLKGGATATTKPGGSTGTTVPSADSNACAAPDGPGAAATSTAPALGIYSYVTCEGGEGADVKVETGSGTDGKTRRRVTIARQGNSITEIRRYDAGAAILEGLDIVSPYGTIHCDVDPDVVEMPAGLAVGKQWSGTGSCSQPPPVGKISFTGTGKVTGAKTVTIGGTAVQTWMIESQLSVTAAGQTQKTNNVTYYDPTRGIDVFQQTTLNGQTVKVRLASLTPRAA